MMSAPTGLKPPDNTLKYATATQRFASIAGVLLVVLMTHAFSAYTQVVRHPVTIAAPIAHDEIREQIAASDKTPDTFVRVDTLLPRESVQGHLRQVGVLEPALKRTLNHDPNARLLKTLGTGAALRMMIDRSGTLERLVVDIHGKPEKALGPYPHQNGASRIVIERNARGEFTAAKEFNRHDVYWRHRVGTIENGFFTSMARADIPSHITASAMRLFQGRIDFRRGFRAGDAFRIIYQSALLDGAPTQTGQILAIEIQAKGIWHQAVWHQNSLNQPAGSGLVAHHPSGTVADGTLPRDGTQVANAWLANGRYYSFNGTPLSASSPWTHPIGYTRITSPFGVRTHPLSGHHHHHTGVDLAAKDGTPVFASADGSVEFVGWKRGYGKLIVVRHNARYSTYYAHLRGFAPGLRRGNRLASGQNIGEVGQTGDVTGPHLHFEVRDRGRPIDPIFALRPRIEPLGGARLASFCATSAVLIAHMERMRAVQGG